VFGKNLLGSIFSKGRESSPSEEAKLSLKMQYAALQGRLAESRSTVVVLSINKDVLKWLDQHLRAVAERNRYEYITTPNLAQASDARVLIMDVTPEADAVLHSRYDKIVRMKKALGKSKDILAVFGPRERYRRYPRGTYPKLLYFCFDPNNFAHQEVDLTLDGLDTHEGPILFNFAHMPAVIGRRLKNGH